jgi:hypothetical protein
MKERVPQGNRGQNLETLAPRRGGRGDVSFPSGETRNQRQAASNSRAI